MLAIAAIFFSVSCTVGPDFERPPAPQVDGYTPEELQPPVATDTSGEKPSQLFLSGSEIPAQWWMVFESEDLNELVEKALQSNPDLDAAQASLRVAQENAYAARGLLFPSVDAGLSASRQKTTGSQYGNPGSPSSIYTLYNASVGVSYALDVFGGAQRNLEAATARAEYQRYQLAASYLSLTSNMVTTAIQVASLRAQIAAVEEIIALEQEQLEVLQGQFDAGATAYTDVLAQRVALLQSKASLPPLNKQLAQQRNQLTALTGQFPSQEIDARFELAQLTLPRELPLSLPSQLVEQRPDIRAAEAQLHQASALVGVATANQFPQFTIYGSFGSTADDQSLFSAGTGVWSIGAGLVQPIFNGGTLTHERRAAEAAYEQAAALYRGTVLAAFQQVADVLRALQADAEDVQAQSTAAQAAAESLEITRQQYADGGISYLPLLTAQQAYQQTRVALVQAQASQYADTAALFQALGGDWWQWDSAAGPPWADQEPGGTP